MHFHLPNSFIAMQSFASLGSVTEMFYSNIQSYHLQRAYYMQGIAWVSCIIYSINPHYHPMNHG